MVLNPITKSANGRVEVHGNKMLKISLTHWILEKCIDTALDRLIINMKSVDPIEATINLFNSVMEDNNIHPSYKFVLLRTYRQWQELIEINRIGKFVDWSKPGITDDIEYLKNKLDNQLGNRKYW
jgi:hypothetical protein